MKNMLNIIAASRRRVSAFDPLSLSPALWLSDTGSDPATWPDLSGNGRDATQATSSLRPTIEANVLNGRQIRRFNGIVNGQQYETSYSLPANHTAFFVATRGTQQNDASTILRPVIEGSNNTNNNGLRSYGTQRGSFENLEAAIESSRITTIPGNWVVDENIIASFTLSGNTLTSHKNGTLFGSVTVTALASHVVHIAGTSRTTTPGEVRRFAGDIAEILIYPTALSTADRQKVEQYLSTKWGITLT
jgi:hypothetical protein